MGFWIKLLKRSRRQKKPIMCLAPMADVTDAAFRRMFVKYGRPDVFWTEFVSADGLCSAGKNNLLIDLKYSSAEHPIVAQIFGAKPKNFYTSARLLAELGFDGIDINMGCPDRKVEKQGAGAALIKNPKLAQEIILATQAGAAGLPVSVKTRIGYNKNETATWMPALLAAKPAAIIVHGRTRQEMSKASARWDIIGRAAEIIKASKKGTLAIGNGDVADLADAYQKAKQYNLDGIMVGRSVFGKPWFFTPTLMREFGSRPLSGFPLTKGGEMNAKKKLEVMAEHTKLFEKLFAGHKNFNIMKKHFKAYASGFEGAKELRIKLMKANNYKEVKFTIDSFSKSKEAR